VIGKYIQAIGFGKLPAEQAVFAGGEVIIAIDAKQRLSVCKT
jgi:hypothetical protein